jgi:hypothetical protein
MDVTLEFIIILMLIAFIGGLILGVDLGRPHFPR